MRLNHDRHLAYSTNVHRGETWREMFQALQTHTLAVRDRLGAGGLFGIGLRLGHLAAADLAAPNTLLEFQRWLDRNNCYVFTINGFPYGRFHGQGVKRRAYMPDWTSPDRLAYTNRLFDLLAQLLPAGIAGSVSTLPGSFKEFNPTPEARKAMRTNLWSCLEHAAQASERTGRHLHLALEPEPLCLLEVSAEVVHFFDRLRAEHPRDPRLDRHLGINYDTCHFAVEFEEPREAIGRLVEHGINISKIHLSSALKVRPTPEALAELRKFSDDVYLHQVIACHESGERTIHPDLSGLLAEAAALPPDPSQEWRIHFHVPLHAPAAPPLDNTTEDLLGALDWLAENPSRCPHLEMETYTWEVLPPELKSRSVVEQLAAEYEWTLARLAERGLR